MYLSQKTASSLHPASFLPTLGQNTACSSRWFERYWPKHLLLVTFHELKDLLLVTYYLLLVTFRGLTTSCSSRYYLLLVTLEIAEVAAAQALHAVFASGYRIYRSRVPHSRVLADLLEENTRLSARTIFGLVAEGVTDNNSANSQHPAI